jgi:hypothetical protein
MVRQKNVLILTNWQGVSLNATPVALTPLKSSNLNLELNCPIDMPQSGALAEVVKLDSACAVVAK